MAEICTGDEEYSYSEDEEYSYSEDDEFAYSDDEFESPNKKVDISSVSIGGKSNKNVVCNFSPIFHELNTL